MTPSTDPDERNHRIRLLPRVITPRRRKTFLLPDVPAPAHWAHLLGTVSEARFAGSGSLWPVPFPPSPPPPVARPCSETSAVLWDCPTSSARSSSAYVLGLPDPSHRSI